jgi:hypothetical protein
VTGGLFELNFPRAGSCSRTLSGLFGCDSDLELRDPAAVARLHVGAMDPPTRDATSHPPPADSLPASPMDTRNASREEELLSTSYQSTDTVRRRPEGLVGSYGKRPPSARSG